MKDFFEGWQVSEKHFPAEQSPEEKLAFFVRYALLALNVPARWQPGKAPLSPLFDPTHLASTFGGGLMRSTGDFFISALFVLLGTCAVLHYARRFLAVPSAPSEETDTPEVPMGRLRFTAGFVLVAGVVFGLTVLLAVVARHAILDSTLDFFTREGLFPRSLVLAIFCTLLLCTRAVVTLIAGLLYGFVFPPSPAHAKSSKCSGGWSTAYSRRTRRIRPSWATPCWSSRTAAPSA